MPSGWSQTEWDTLRGTLLACIAADFTAVTGTGGKAVFTGLSAGLYLVDKTDMTVGGSTWQYAAALLAVPGADSGGNWVYDVTSVPKHTEKPCGGDDPDTPVTYTVVKLWVGKILGQTPRQRGDHHLQGRCCAGKTDTVLRE